MRSEVSDLGSESSWAELATREGWRVRGEEREDDRHAREGKKGKVPGRRGGAFFTCPRACCASSPTSVNPRLAGFRTRDQRATQTHLLAICSFCAWSAATLSSFVAL